MLYTWAVTYIISIIYIIIYILPVSLLFLFFLSWGHLSLGLGQEDSLGFNPGEPHLRSFPYFTSARTLFPCKFLCTASGGHDMDISLRGTPFYPLQLLLLPSLGWSHHAPVWIPIGQLVMELAESHWRRPFVQEMMWWPDSKTQPTTPVWPPQPLTCMRVQSTDLTCWHKVWHHLGCFLRLTFCGYSHSKWE